MSLLRNVTTLINNRRVFFQFGPKGWTLWFGAQRLKITYHRRSDDPN